MTKELQHRKKPDSGLVVSMLTFNSDNASSNPTEAYSFFRKCVFEKNEHKQKEAMVGQL